MTVQVWAIPNFCDIGDDTESPSVTDYCATPHSTSSDEYFSDWGTGESHLAMVKWQPSQSLALIARNPSKQTRPMEINDCMINQKQTTTKMIHVKSSNLDNAESVNTIHGTCYCNSEYDTNHESKELDTHKNVKTNGSPQPLDQPINNLLIGRNEVYNSPQKWTFKSTDYLDSDRLAKNAFLENSGGTVKRVLSNSPIVIKDSVFRSSVAHTPNDSHQSEGGMDDFKLDDTSNDQKNVSYGETDSKICEETMASAQYMDLRGYFSYKENKDSKTGFNQILNGQEFVIQYWNKQQLLYEEGISVSVLPEDYYYTSPQTISRYPFDAVNYDSIVIVMAASNPQSNWSGWTRGQSVANVLDVNYVSNYMDAFPR